MKEIIEYLKARYLSEKAQGIVEYALILAFVVVVAAALTKGDDLRGKIEGVFNSVSNAFGTTGNGAGGK